MFSFFQMVGKILVCKYRINSVPVLDYNFLEILVKDYQDLLLNNINNCRFIEMISTSMLNRVAYDSVVWDLNILCITVNIIFNINRQKKVIWYLLVESLEWAKILKTFTPTVVRWIFRNPLQLIDWFNRA